MKQNKISLIKVSKKHIRPTWDEYFIKVMQAVAERATCDRGRSGCVIARDNQILVTGYVGSPPGQPHCDDVGHEMHKVINDDGVISEHCIGTIHAEQNALIQAARRGVAVYGADLYCQMMPCYTCARFIVAAGIKRVVAYKDYQRAEKSRKLFKAAGVMYQLINTEIQKY